MKLLRKNTTCCGGMRVEIEEVEVETAETSEFPVAEQLLVEFFTMEEVFEMYPNHFFDKYGNLILFSLLNKHVNSLAPIHFCDLGTKHHINKGCGFDLEDTFIKKRLGGVRKKKKKENKPAEYSKGYAKNPLREGINADESYRK